MSSNIAMDEAREWVRRQRAQERGLVVPDQREPVFEDDGLGRGGMDPSGSESALDWSIESVYSTPVKFLNDW